MRFSGPLFQFTRMALGVVREPRVPGYGIFAASGPISRPDFCWIEYCVFQKSQSANLTWNPTFRGPKDQAMPPSFLLKKKKLVRIFSVMCRWDWFEFKAPSLSLPPPRVDGVLKICKSSCPRQKHGPTSLFSKELFCKRILGWGNFRFVLQGVSTLPRSFTLPRWKHPPRREGYWIFPANGTRVIPKAQEAKSGGRTGRSLPRPPHWGLLGFREKPLET